MSDDFPCVYFAPKDFNWPDGIAMARDLSESTVLLRGLTNGERNGGYQSFINKPWDKAIDPKRCAEILSTALSRLSV